MVSPTIKHPLSKGEKGTSKRMAQVASIYFIQRFVRKPEDIIKDFFEKKSEEETTTSVS
jgi:tRNA 2-selenouridine synthase SelU